MQNKQLEIQDRTFKTQYLSVEQKAALDQLQALPNNRIFTQSELLYWLTSKGIGVGAGTGERLYKHHFYRNQASNNNWLSVFQGEFGDRTILQVIFNEVPRIDAVKIRLTYFKIRFSYRQPDDLAGFPIIQDTVGNVQRHTTYRTINWQFGLQYNNDVINGQLNSGGYSGHNDMITATFQPLCQGVSLGVIDPFERTQELFIEHISNDLTDYVYFPNPLRGQEGYQGSAQVTVPLVFRVQIQDHNLVGGQWEVGNDWMSVHASWYTNLEFGLLASYEQV